MGNYVDVRLYTFKSEESTTRTEGHFVGIFGPMALEAGASGYFNVGHDDGVEKKVATVTFSPNREVLERVREIAAKYVLREDYLPKNPLSVGGVVVACGNVSMAQCVDIRLYTLPETGSVSRVNGHAASNFGPQALSIGAAGYIITGETLKNGEKRIVSLTFCPSMSVLANVRTMAKSYVGTQDFLPENPISVGGTIIKCGVGF
ncbi:MAG: hypothetical protein KKE44_17445 [Proteobacteria bacterium]|nr:hypothetical protein [Pseudomonadota bacterium]MBU1584517.1 hypothetical protein [Pseudomonadota bacterium]MBU2451774.1 hypothetical protein [Pseudomonadota bacterium]MBU2630967.1 hypothetical protein [Pseudomonadota bacterium]